MSKIGVSFKIDVNKIDKARLFKGAKGTYLDITSFIDLDQLDQYDNSGMITQDVTKEEKAQGVKGPILGNCKVFWSDSGQAPQKEAAHNQQQQYQPQQQAPNHTRTAPHNQQYQPPQDGVQQPLPRSSTPGRFRQPAQPLQQPGHNEFSDFDDDIPFNQAPNAGA